MKDFFELKLVTMTMEEYEKRFFEFLKYVDFIKDDKFKIQRFMSGLPSFYSDNIQYDNRNTLEETIRIKRNLYEKSKGKLVLQKDWNDNMKGKKDQRKKFFKPPFFRINPKKINEVKQPEMSTILHIHLQKGQVNSLYNVGDVRGITYIGTSLTKKKE
jgi:hypothetical protein